MIQNNEDKCKLDKNISNKAIYIQFVKSFLYSWFL
jgi:hypothetical protein